MPDAEIEAMGKVVDALGGLEEDERDRVLRWAADRYGIAMSRPGDRRPDRDVENGDGDVDYGRDNHDQTGHEAGEKPEFEDFASFYDVAAPDTDAERVLVASYWTQVHDGKAAFGSQELNKVLKELGHGVRAINKAMSANIEKKPALVLQVTRNGSTQQARKKYKMTEAGKKWVAARLA